MAASPVTPESVRRRLRGGRSKALGVVLMGFGLRNIGLAGALGIAALIIMGVGLTASFVLTKPAAQRAR